DHGGIVRAELERREPGLGKRRAQARVRGDASDDRDSLEPRLLDSRADPLHESAQDRALVGRGKVWPPPLDLVLSEIANRVQERGLEPGEGEVEPGHARDRERERGGVALTGKTVDLRPAGIPEPEQPRPLVEGLAGSVVERRAEPLGDAALADG